MKPLSEALMNLAARVERFEDSAPIVGEQESAALQARREHLEAAIDREVKEVGQTAADSLGAARSWWLDIKAPLVRQCEVMRTDFNKWRAELVERDGEQSAWDAEHDAVAAITLCPTALMPQNGLCYAQGSSAPILASGAGGEDNNRPWNINSITAFSAVAAICSVLVGISQIVCGHSGYARRGEHSIKPAAW